MLPRPPGLLHSELRSPEKLGSPVDLLELGCNRTLWLGPRRRRNAGARTTTSNNKILYLITISNTVRKFSYIKLT